MWFGLFLVSAFIQSSLEMLQVVKELLAASASEKDGLKVLNCDDGVQCVLFVKMFLRTVDSFQVAATVS